MQAFIVQHVIPGFGPSIVNRTLTAAKQKRDIVCACVTRESECDESDLERFEHIDMSLAATARLHETLAASRRSHFFKFSIERARECKGYVGALVTLAYISPTQHEIVLSPHSHVYFFPFGFNE